MLSPTVKADILLLLMAVIWGTAFVAQRFGSEHISPLYFNAIRFSLGAFVLAGFLVGKRRLRIDQATLKFGSLLGVVLAAGGYLQQAGVELTSVGNSGFLTILYVVFVPLIDRLLGKSFSPWVGFSAACCLGGAFLLSFNGEWEVNRGDALIVASGFLWAVHMILLSGRARKFDALMLALVQFVVCALLSGGVAFFRESLAPGAVTLAMYPILYCGAISIGLGYTLQVVAQRHAVASHVAIIGSTECVFAAVSGAVVFGERLSSQGLLGCGLILAGAIISQVKK